MFVSWNVKTSDREGEVFGGRGGGKISGYEKIPVSIF